MICRSQRREPIVGTGVNMTKSYIDIGHGDRNATLWLHDSDRIYAFKAGDDTHESIWRSPAMDCWRGRFDSKTMEISVQAPVLYKGSSIPTWLLDKLEVKFGTGLQTWRFNPMKEGKRVR